MRRRPADAGQVCDEKTNVVEPLLTHRKTMTTPKPGAIGTPGNPTCCGRSRGVACMLLWRCPVYRWRELVVGAGMEQENLSSRYGGRKVARGRTASGGHRERASTDARHRGGPARSSVEGPVMGLEPRGRAGQITQMPTRTGRS